MLLRGHNRDAPPLVRRERWAARPSSTERVEFANTLPAVIAEDGLDYASVEHYFQAHKTTCVEARRRVAAASFDQVHALGNAVELRPDWERVKLKVMLRACKLKYDQHPALRNALAVTEGPITFTPSAGFWGPCAARIFLPPITAPPLCARGSSVETSCGGDAAISVEASRGDAAIRARCRGVAATVPSEC